MQSRRYLFFDYGFAGIDLFLNSYLNNITIDLTIVKPTAYMCSPKFSLTLDDGYTDYNLKHDSISINQVFISGYSEICYEYHKAMQIHLHQSDYGMDVELCNSQFYNMNQMALHIRMSYANSSLLIKNCTFRYIKHTVAYLTHVVHGEISSNNATIRFENCAFCYNTASYIVKMEVLFDDLCVHPSNFYI